MDVFIKSPNTGDPLVGLVWPGGTTWVDWFHPNATKYWHSEFDYFRQTVEFDGLWIDMNEPSNMVIVFHLKPLTVNTQLTGNVDGGCEENRWNRPPYKTHAFGHEISDR